MEIEWKPVEIQTRYLTPFVKIYNCQLCFNAGVYSLIDNIYDYSYAIVSAGVEKGGAVTKVSIKFVKEYESNVLRVYRQKRSNGILINSKSLAEYCINCAASCNNTNAKQRYPVIKLDSHTIAIDLSKRMKYN